MLFPCRIYFSFALSNTEKKLLLHQEMHLFVNNVLLYHMKIQMFLIAGKATNQHLQQLRII